MGTPDFAVQSLKRIHEAGHEIAAVVTVPDKPAGRGQKIQLSPVKQYAMQIGADILQPEKLKDPDFLAALKAYNAELFVVVAFRMLPEVVWSMPPKGTINLHASLLPQYRGAAPINHAIINGDTETGTTVFFIEKEIDTGLIISKKVVPILPEDNAGTLHDKLMFDGAEHLVETISKIENNNYKTENQQLNTDTNLRPAPKIFKETCKINWAQPAETIHNFVRGLSPYPAAWMEFALPNSKPFTAKIFETAIGEACNLPAGTIESDNKTYLRIATANKFIVIRSLQPEGKRRMPVEDFLRGKKLQ